MFIGIAQYFHNMQITIDFKEDLLRLCNMITYWTGERQSWSTVSSLDFPLKSNIRILNCMLQSTILNQVILVRHKAKPDISDYSSAGDFFWGGGGEYFIVEELRHGQHLGEIFLIRPYSVNTSPNEVYFPMWEFLFRQHAKCT